MRKIINGRMYNTETAKNLAEWSNGRGWGDFTNCVEELFRKKTGEYFLCGEGGPMTQYAVSEGNGWTGGKKIIPLTEREAKQWAEEHLDADKYIEIFGEVEE